MVDKSLRKHNGKGEQRVNETALLKLNPPSFYDQALAHFNCCMDPLGVYPYGMSVRRLNSRYKASYSTAAASQHSEGCPTSSFG